MTERNNQLLIRKYANRRLYNTESSEYTTLAVISKIIKSGRDVRIVDKVSGEDLTREYMIKIIVENESRELPVLSLEILHNMVRSYNEQILAMVPKLLEASQATFYNDQNQFLKKFQNTSFTDKNLKDIQTKLEEFFSLMFPLMARSQKNIVNETDQSSLKYNREEEIRDLKSKLVELQKKLDGIEL